MGIVAHCPMGHRVKVKDHLAGKKGVCPTCGTTFRIPRLESAAVRPLANGLPVAAVVSLDHDLAATLPPALALAPPGSSPAAAQPAEPRQDPPAITFEPLEPDADMVVAADDLSSAPVPAVIDEAPHASWCVAVPGGEASSAMSGEAILEWLGTGDVTGAELVWRSDWPEWRPIGEVFPDHSPPSTSGDGLAWR
ncbi:MAG: hypothetical protein K8S94_06465 [Planctomycetia bacterium]|nr:hypothetical protein [Planctomycetia bacterium]